MRQLRLYGHQSILYSINVILQSQGASLANIVDMTVFLTNMGDYGAMNEVRITLVVFK